ncbi:MAG: glutamate racemase [Flavobacteriia bacterium]|nr:glutamate racemase [Flavobacteriia bacterium]
MGPIGVFDSGFGGLTILKAFKENLPQYDYIYLGDNARTPYGNRSFETVYRYTLESVEYLFEQGCELIILACNTASAKALRTIQQQVLPKKYPNKKVLGVLRPSTELVGDFSKTRHIGILATEGTVKSESYLIEINKFFPDIIVQQLACPIWVPLIENNLHSTEGGKWFLERDLKMLLEKDEKIDVILLACTHYPIVLPLLQSMVKNVLLLPQSQIVADSLMQYLKKHQEVENLCTKNSTIIFLTSDTAENFETKGSFFYGEKIKAKQVKLG